MAQVTMESPEEDELARYYVILDGVVGNGMRGDIAIDDISIVDGYCADYVKGELEMDGAQHDQTTEIFVICYHQLANMFLHLLKMWINLVVIHNLFSFSLYETDEHSKNM